MATQILLEDFENGPNTPFPGYPPPDTPSSNYAFDLGYSLARLNGSNGRRIYQCAPGIVGNPRLNAAFASGKAGLSPWYYFAGSNPAYSGNFCGRLQGGARLSILQSGASNGMGLFLASSRFAGVATPVTISWSDVDYDRGGWFQMARDTGTSFQFTAYSYWDGASTENTYEVAIPSTYSDHGPWIEMRMDVNGYMATVVGGGDLFRQPLLHEMPPDGMKFKIDCFARSDLGSGGSLAIDHIYGYPGIARGAKLRAGVMKRAFSTSW